MSLATPSRARLRVRASPLALGLGSLGTVALAVAALALIGVGSSSGDRAGAAGDGSAGPLVWAAPPRVYVAPGMPRDRILSGVVRNDSLRVAEVKASGIEVIDAGGDRLRSAAIFLGSFSRGLYAGPRKAQASDIEERRTGRLLRIGPGTEQPLTVSWRLGPDGASAGRIEYRGGSLRAP